MHSGRAFLDAEAILETPPAPGEGLELGRSREDRPVVGFEIGIGSRLVTLIAGCHADEPVGPELLDRLATYLERLPDQHRLTRDLTWRLVPHVNPDGEARNRGWTGRTVETLDHRRRADRGYQLESYLREVVRELPGDDIEFGFPSGDPSRDEGVRPENLAVAAFLSRQTRSSHTILLHGSLHGMGLAPGPWFLLERSWADRTRDLRKRLTAATLDMGYRLFDAERHGEKGFHRIAAGFTSRPDSQAMREHFERRGAREMAARFRPSSMEFARSRGGDPITLVTEMPLFLVASLPDGLIERADLDAVRAGLQEALARGSAQLEAVARDLGVTPMPIRDQMRLQLLFLEECLQTATGASSAGDRLR